MTRNLAVCLDSFNIRCNSICSDTTLAPATANRVTKLKITMYEFVKVKKKCLKRLGSSQEIANLMIFLVSDLCHFATVASCLIDRGYTNI